MKVEAERWKTPPALMAMIATAMMDMEQREQADADRKAANKVAETKEAAIKVGVQR